MLQMASDRLSRRKTHRVTPLIGNNHTGQGSHKREQQSERQSWQPLQPPASHHAILTQPAQHISARNQRSLLGPLKAIAATARLLLHIFLALVECLFGLFLLLSLKAVATRHSHYLFLLMMMNFNTCCGNVCKRLGHATRTHVTPEACCRNLHSGS